VNAAAKIVAVAVKRVIGGPFKLRFLNMIRGTIQVPSRKIEKMLKNHQMDFCNGIGGTFHWIGALCVSLLFGCFVTICVQAEQDWAAHEF